ncbi:type II toxin-antitoxin system RelE/ParE family toxin [Methanocalculus sp.]|jgi:mRNA interferase RelE/StbE|uniref:type II toxin-antitoxin system RelE family toxin n=1 Tax=Methanocalculus sp. TaxID=2004547 RepID=UPI0017B92DD0|nr:type II toxin-antitoxin system RelE/ParE family toxin [Methanocalculus sp.]
MKYRVFLENRANRDLELIDEPDHLQIYNKLQQLKEGFSPDLDIRKLKGIKNTYRLRVGNWRIIFELCPDYQIVIIGIRPRKNAYRDY